jgi:uncharacterized protein (TIGR04255 family)
MDTFEKKPLKLDNPPIVEAVVDIDCDMPPKFKLAECGKAASERFSDRYPRHEQQLMANFALQIVEEKEAREPVEPPRAKSSLSAHLFKNHEGNQLVQVRQRGFSFNRLSPYSGLDEYLPEIERVWRIFVELTHPAAVRQVRLRYINRILLPLDGGGLDLGEYFQVSPQLPTQSNLTFTGFLNQHSAVEADTGHLANIALSGLPPENGALPVLFDIQVHTSGGGEVADWPWIRKQIFSLRDLKNRIFENTLTEKCLNLHNSSSQ